MDEVRQIDAEHKEAKRQADKKADLRAMAIARQVDAGPRGTAAEIARELGVKEPTISHAVRRGRALLAKLAQQTAKVA